MPTRRFSLDFQGFPGELAGLPAPYAPPVGCLLLAKRDDSPIGAVGLKPLIADIAELKRLYVLPEARGTGAGRALVARALDAAHAGGYRRVRLDTHRPSLSAAVGLYRRFGFVEIPPYAANPGREFAFFEKLLQQDAREDRQRQERP